MGENGYRYYAAQQLRTYDLIAALRRLGTSRESTWVFEDSLYAVSTAKAAGFPVAVVEDKCSEKDRPELRALSDQYLVRYSDFRWEDTL